MGENPKFYVGTSVNRLSLIEGVRHELKQAGWKSVYDWYDMTGKSVEEVRKGGENETRGVLEADVVCICLPGGYGTHVELGLALARHKISGGRNLLVLQAEQIADFDPYGGSGVVSPFYIVEGVNKLICPLDSLATNLQTLWRAYRGRLTALTPRGGGLGHPVSH